MTKGILCICTDEDPKLELSSRLIARRDTPRNNPSVGTKDKTTCEGDTQTHTDDEDGDALFLTADVPHSYREAMG